MEGERRAFCVDANRRTAATEGGDPVLLAEVASAESVQSLDSKLQLLIQIIAFSLTVAVLFYGTEAVKGWILGAWQKLKGELKPSPSPAPLPVEGELQPIRRTLPSRSRPAGYDNAAQTLLQQIAADPSVRSTVMTVEKSDGVYELKFTAKGPQE